MYDQVLFYLVFLSQVLLISWLFPRAIAGRAAYVLETYPPETHPRLYPLTAETFRRTLTTYRLMNLAVLAVGLFLVFLGFYAPSEGMLNWDTKSVLTAYFFLQFVPLMLMGAAGMVYFNLQRVADSRTKRTADLRPRRLLDFVSPPVFALAVGTYIAFVLFIVYVRQFHFPWFGGYWNIVGITAANLFFAVIAAHALYGKRKDPYQDHEDRLRQIGIVVRSLVWVSIFATAFVALSIALSAFELRHIEPIFMSLYFQVIAGVSLRSTRIDDINFEVYREEPAAT